jgi:MFS transporter, DHA1 family, multidrug resistance protein
MIGLAAARRAVATVEPALWILAAVGFISQVGIAVMLPLLPLFATELGASPTVLGLLTSAFAVTNGIGQLLTGFLAERWSSRRLMSVGVGLYAAMNLLIATAASAGWLLAWRSLAGFGGGAMLVSERIYVAEVTEPSRRAFANGIVSAAQSAGSVAGPAVGGLAALASLRAPFLIVAGTSTLALLGTLMLRPSRAAQPGAAPAHADAEAGTALPYRRIAVLLAANLALMAGYGSFITTYAPLATGRLGWSTLDVGIVFSFFGAGSILLGPALAHLADRAGRRPVAIVATLPIAAFGAALVLEASRPLAFSVAFVAGAGLTTYTASWYAMLADASGSRRRGRVFGVVSAISNTGIVVGAMAAAQLWERIDIGAGLMAGSVAVVVAGLALLAFRPAGPRPVPELAA